MTTSINQESLLKIAETLYPLYKEGQREFNLIDLSQAQNDSSLITAIRFATENGYAIKKNAGLIIEFLPHFSPLLLLPANLLNHPIATKKRATHKKI